MATKNIFYSIAVNLLLFLLFLLSPFLILIAVLVFMSLGRPVLFLQTRPGYQAWVERTPALWPWPMRKNVKTSDVKKGA